MTIDHQPKLLNDPAGDKPRKGETGVHTGDVFVDFPIVRRVGGAIVSHADRPAVTMRDFSERTELEKKPVNLERLRAVVDLLGFVPTDKEEITLAIGNAKETLGFAKYLNRVLGHQENKTTSQDPSAAIHAKVRQVAHYADNARSNVGMLRAVQDELVDRNTLDRMTSWRSEGSTKRALKLVGLSDAVHTALGHDDEFTIENVPIDSIIDAIIAEGDVTGFKSSLERTIVEQQVRFEHWAECLREACAHGQVSDLAAEKLRVLGVTIQQ